MIQYFYKNLQGFNVLFCLLSVFQIISFKKQLNCAPTSFFICCLVCYPYPILCAKNVGAKTKIKGHAPCNQYLGA